MTSEQSTATFARAISFAMTLKVASSVSALPAVVCWNVYVPAAVGVHVATPSPLPDAKGAPFNVTDIVLVMQDHTAIENTSVKSAGSKKFFENGQLVIIKNGVKYNALGAQL